MNCQFPACKSERIYQNSLCYDHWRLFGSNPPVKETNTIPKVSANRKELEKEYSKLKKEIMKESNKCEAGLNGCTKVAEDLHHITKRSTKNMCDRNNLIRVCRSCHTYIENNPLQAIELGLSKSKHKL